MKIKLYTQSHRADLLKAVDNGGGQFTAEEHAYVIEQESAAQFASQDSLLRAFLSRNSVKLEPLGFLAEHLSRAGLLNVISLGAGNCVLEYLLSCSLPEKATVVASDFDPFLIGKAKMLLPGIVPVTFDFFKDDIAELQRKLGIPLDAAVFWGSAYVMDDDQFVKLFSGLRKIGVKRVIDFHAGYMDWKGVVSNWGPVAALRGSARARRLLGKPALDEFPGKFHGYSRSRGELRRLYRASGLKISRELTLGNYKYIAICDR